MCTITNYRFIISALGSVHNEVRDFDKIWLNQKFESTEFETMRVNCIWYPLFFQKKTAEIFIILTLTLLCKSWTLALLCADDNCLCSFCFLILSFALEINIYNVTQRNTKGSRFTQESQGKYVTQRNTKGSRSTQESQGKYVTQRNTKGSRFTQDLPWLSCVNLEPLHFFVTYLPWLSCVNLEPLVFLCFTYLPWLSCVNLEPLVFLCVTYLPWLSCVNLGSRFTQESQGKYVTQRNTKGSRSTQESQGKYVKQRNTWTLGISLCYILTLTLLCKSWTLGISLCYILTLTLLCKSWTLGISLCYILHKRVRVSM
jgi:hypothetical protein